MAGLTLLALRYQGQKSTLNNCPQKFVSPIPINRNQLSPKYFAVWAFTALEITFMQNSNSGVMGPICLRFRKCVYSEDSGHKECSMRESHL